MTDSGKYVEYIMEQAQKLLAIDSPSGYGREVREYLLRAASLRTWEEGIRRMRSC